MKKITIKFRQTKLSAASKQQIYDYFDSRKKQQTKKHITIFGDELGILHFWR